MNRFLSLTSLTVLAGLIFTSGCKEPTQPGAAKAAAEKAASGERERVPAEVGVAKQGRVIGDKEGIMRTPAKALINTKQKVAYEFKVKHAVDLYEGEHGYKPKTHEIFMKEIIEFNEIELPELPEGHEYVWDPEKGQLMVDRPKE